MKAAKRNYVMILRIELDDLFMDIEALIDQCAKGAAQGNISQNVFMQNLAVFKNELLGLNEFRQVLDDLAADEYESLDALIKDIRQKFLALMRSHALVGALQLYVDRKLDKVARYVKQ